MKRPGVFPTEHSGSRTLPPDPRIPPVHCAVNVQQGWLFVGVDHYPCRGAHRWSCDCGLADRHPCEGTTEAGDGTGGRLLKKSLLCTHAHYVCVSSGALHPRRGQRTTFGNRLFFFFSHPVDPGIEFRPSDLFGQVAEPSRWPLVGRFPAQL